MALLGACSRGNDARSDDALKNDLALASQAQAYKPQQFVSPTEAGLRRTATERAAHAPRPRRASRRPRRVVPRPFVFQRRLELVGAATIRRRRRRDDREAHWS